LGISRRRQAVAATKICLQEAGGSHGLTVVHRWSSRFSVRAGLHILGSHAKA